VPYDVRRAHPYSVYPELEFDIPTRTEGDSYARYLLHLDEIRESIRIIDQVPARDARRAGHGQDPAADPDPPGRAYVAIESPRGQYACYGMSDGSDQPFRCASTTRRSSTWRR
jgi:NADH-quinone oxidoreductase subunit D